MPLLTSLQRTHLILLHQLITMLITDVQGLDFIRLEKQSFESFPSDSIDYNIIEVWLS